MKISHILLLTMSAPCDALLLKTTALKVADNYVSRILPACLRPRCVAKRCDPKPIAPVRKIPEEREKEFQAFEVDYEDPQQQTPEGRWKLLEEANEKISKFHNKVNTAYFPNYQAASFKGKNEVAFHNDEDAFKLYMFMLSRGQNLLGGSLSGYLAKEQVGLVGLLRDSPKPEAGGPNTQKNVAYLESMRQSYVKDGRQNVLARLVGILNKEQ